jgi:hypothetical protein
VTGGVGREVRRTARWCSKNRQIASVRFGAGATRSWYVTSTSVPTDSGAYAAQPVPAVSRLKLCSSANGQDARSSTWSPRGARPVDPMSVRCTKYRRSRSRRVTGESKAGGPDREMLNAVPLDGSYARAPSTPFLSSRRSCEYVPR